MRHLLRDLSLLSIAGQIFAQVMLVISNMVLPDVQYGFRKGRKHYRLRGLSFEGKVLGTKQTFMLLLLTKAFGMVNCDILGFPGKMWMVSSISYLPGISHRHEDIKLVLALSIQSASLHLATSMAKSR